SPARQMIRWQKRWRRRQIPFFASENPCCAFCPAASLGHCHLRFAKPSRTCQKTKRLQSSVPATLVFRRRAIRKNSKCCSWADKTLLQQANPCQFLSALRSRNRELFLALESKDL